MLLKERQVDEFAMNYEFITKVMLSSNCIFLQLFEMKAAVFKCMKHFIKKRFTHIILLQ